MHIGALSAVLLALASPVAACVSSLPSGIDFPNTVVTTRDAVSGIAAAWFDGASTQYAHGILGDAIEPTVLGVAIVADCKTMTIAAGADHVFEDVAPRLHDLDGDGTQEVIVVRTNVNKGAQLAVYGLKNGAPALLDSTPYIGRTHRWLAPVGVADLDDDGRIELAYVDRPHLAKILTIWRWVNGQLMPVTAASGLTNHKIGEARIGGGIRDCGQGPQMIVASADWRRVLAVELRDDALLARDLAPFRDPSSLDAAMRCEF